MNRLHLDATRGALPQGGPDMTILEAADAMERTHETRLVVRFGNRIVGLLTEEDIVRKVLAAGRRPDAVRVADIMMAGRELKDGSFLVEEEPVRVLDGEEQGPLAFVQLPQGKCEECGDFSVDLEERDGLLLCSDCVESVSTSYA